ncbi:unnamed protein product [Medioppia subpectinata]|uniref:Chaperone DnaJ C-terminal domain-containing protein n=1 Tax=Medioppia subpectinata TaxID=1979941 RepID=A0A7R9PWS2_9ACAR|nr:unnamed protein product [Medioppia subpectinata]CAG2104063.1 unnamed protein product [Medioppia subpectinata]
MANIDYYMILGVLRTAIKNIDHKFKLIQEVYRVLSDRQRRQVYDIRHPTHGNYRNRCVEHTVYVSLRDVLRGCTKRMKVTRKLWYSVREFATESEILTIVVKRGSKSGTRMVFAGRGNHPYYSCAEDIVFVLKDRPDNRFRRHGNDIVYTARIDLVDATVDQPIAVPLPSGRTLDVSLDWPDINRLFNHRKCLILKVGLGLPDGNNAAINGDLIIECVIN